MDNKEFLEDSLKSWLREIENELLLSYRNKGIEASGRWGNELRSRTLIRGNHVIGEIIGTNYTPYIEFGLPPSKRMPPVSAIEKWIIDKGLRIPKKYRNLNSFAWAIAKTIQKKGTSWYRKGGSHMISDVIDNYRIKEFLDIISEDILNAQFWVLTKDFQKI